MSAIVIALAGRVVASEAERPTFASDIAPVIYANCTVCHRPGETAPFSLGSYAEVKKHAREVAELTGRRLMPPWKANSDVHFLGERRLTEAQIAAIGRWVAQGCMEGDLTAEPVPPVFAAGWQLGKPDEIVTMSEAYPLAADGPDVYRCFVIPMHIPPGRYLRAAEFQPGNRRIVHHAVLSTLPAEEAAKRLADEPAGVGPGFSSGLPAPGERLAGPLGIWVPGKDVLPLPDGYAVAWPTGSVLIAQLHLHPDGKPEQEKSSIGVYFTDHKPVGVVQAMVLFNKKVDIRPGEKNYTLRSSKTLKDDSQIVGLFPHMHLLGRTVHLTATLPDGSTQPLLSIDEWDFNWQGYYQPSKTTRLPAGTRVDCVWTFDNSTDNPANPSHPPRRVRFGEQTTNEMGAMVLDVIAMPPLGHVRTE